MSPNAIREEDGNKCALWQRTSGSANGAGGGLDQSRCHQSNKMTDHGDYNLSQIEELILCGNCRRTFNDSNLVPKDLACKHTFCLECITTGLGKATTGSNVRERELYCVLCWKLTELTDKGPEGLETNGPKLNLVKLYMTLKSNGPTLTNGNGPHIDSTPEADQIELCLSHRAPLCLWCTDCKKPLCVKCRSVEPESHKIWTLDQMKKMAIKEMAFMNHLDDNVRQLARRQRQFLILIRDACTALIREVQSNLDSDWNVDPTAEIRDALAQIQIALLDAKSPKDVHELFSLALLKKQSLQTKCQELIIQCQLNDLIGHSDDVFNFDSLQQAVTSILANDNDIKPIPLKQPIQDPILFLTNYCMSQLFSRVHQRPNGDSAFLSHSMQRQLVITPPEALNEPKPSMLTPTQTLAEPLDSYLDSNDSQVEYHHQIAPRPPSVSFDDPTDVDLSRPSTPPDSYSPPEPFASPPPPAAQPAAKPFIPLAATSAQMVQLNQAMALERERERAEPSAPIIHPPVRPVPTRSPANVSPRYYFNIDINGVSRGRIVIETRPDVAPKMCRNFDRLTNTDRKPSYKGCTIFQCWKNESVISGDYEYNTGRGGRSIYEEPYFQPDETRLPAIRGAVGMRRQQKKHDYFGYVGSQFRIVLQDTLNFTGIFGQVVEGIDVVDLIANHGDATGKPIKPIVITKCGKLT